MKKIGVLVKEISESSIKNRLGNSEGVFVVKYSGVASPALSTLRLSLKGSNAQFFVVKNSVARRALKDSVLEPLVKKIDGPCGLIFTPEEPVSASKILCDFKKDHEQLKIEGCFLKERVLEPQEIEALAKLPSKEVLLTQAVIALKSPITNFVRVLNGTLSKFVICLNKIREKKETEQGGKNG